MRLIDLAGRRFGKLTVISRVPTNDHHNKARWECRCDCGKTVVEVGVLLMKRKNSQHCGCVVQTTAVVPTELDKAYAAGFFDGEGSVMIWRPSKEGVARHRLHVSICQADRRPLAWLNDRWGGCIQFRKAPKKGNARPVWFWAISCQKAAKFISDLRPFLVHKPERVDIALQFQKTMLEVRARGVRFGLVTPEMFQQREQYRDEIMRLNKRGAA